jgi:Flp pilus assembly protein TadD
MMLRLRYLGLKWKAMALLVAGLRDLAMEVFKCMVAEFPSDPYALASMAHLQAQGGDRRAALRSLAQLVEIEPRNGRHWFNQGFILEELGDYPEAEDSFRRATQLSPELDRAWYGLGLVLIRLERFDDAVSALKQNTKLQPMSPYGWYQLARVHVDRHEPEEAVKIIHHLKGFEPKVAAQLERETGLRTAPNS